jgi:flagellar FliJ protein
MAFRFRLQTVLEHRTHLEDLAMQRFGVKLQAQAECERHIAWLQKEMRRARQELYDREQAGMPAKEYILANEYVTVLRLQVLREQARLPLLKAETEAARQELVEATRARKVLEALRDSHRAEYDREQLLAEQRLLDEVAVGAYVRRLEL